MYCLKLQQKYNNIFMDQFFPSFMRIRDIFLSLIFKIEILFLSQLYQYKERGSYGAKR